MWMPFSEPMNDCRQKNTGQFSPLRTCLAMSATVASSPEMAS